MLNNQLLFLWIPSIYFLLISIYDIWISLNDCYLNRKEKRDAELENSRFSSTPVKKIKLEECVQVKVEPGLLPESTIKTEMVQIKSEIPDDLKFEFPDNVDVKPFKTEFKFFFWLY